MPIAKKNDIPQDFVNQIKQNLSKSDPTENTVNQVIQNPAVLKNTSTKEKYADVMNIRLSKGRRNEIKAFCTNCGVTVTQYIESSFEYLAKEVAAGNIVISKGGITKLSN